MSFVRESLENSFKASLMYSLHPHIDVLIDTGRVLVVPFVEPAYLVDRDAWRHVAGTYAYFVGLLTVVRVNTSNYVSCWMDNAGQGGFIAAQAVLAHADVDAILARLNVATLPQGFRHPLNIPPELWRLADVVAAEAAIAAYVSAGLND